MDTVRFSKIVESSGKPDTHLLLIDPANDKTLQAAIKSNRVMTVYQGSGNAKTDYGTIGFEEGSSRQFLVFPKTLKLFAGKRVIGIKYDLLESIPVSEDEATSKPKSGTASKQTRDQAPTEPDSKPKSLADAAAVKPAGSAQSKQKPSARVYAREKKPAPGARPEKVVEFPKPEPNAQPVGRNDEVERLKRRVREAIDVLEQGKQVAAYNLLKSIVEE
jgi:hypothetical protein